MNIYVTSKRQVNGILNSTLHILERAEKWIQENDKDEKTVLEFRLAPDMFPLIRQFQIISDNAKGIISRLSHIEAPKFNDTETTIQELKERIKKTQEFVNAVEIDPVLAESAVVAFPWRPGKKLIAPDYLIEYALPNIYFHLTTAYALLRANGLDIGKMDYIGNINWLES